MAKSAWPWGLINKLAGSDLSATAALREFRHAGGHMATSAWYRMWGEVQNELALGGIETGKNLNFRPEQHEVIRMTTVRASGYMQRVNVFAKNASGEVFTKTIDVRVSDLIARKNAIKRAVQTVENFDTSTVVSTGSDIQQVLGAVYAGTYELVPD